MALEIEQFICRSDNYGVLFHDPASGATAAIDAPDAAPIEAALAARGWRLTDIFVTHHHGDHTAGIEALKAKHRAKVTGPKREAEKIPGLDATVAGGDTVKLGSVEFKVLDLPGHTLGHIGYHAPSEGVAAVGDTLFAMGCGRILEGTPQMLWSSLETLARLPHSTQFYCGHEYTVANARFAVTIEPDNANLVARFKEVEAVRAKGGMTLPTTLEAELKTNPFLRAKEPSVKARLNLTGAQDWQVFAEIRARKDKF